MKIPIIHGNTKRRLGMAFTGKDGVKLSVISIIDA